MCDVCEPSQPVRQSRHYYRVINPYSYWDPTGVQSYCPIHHYGSRYTRTEDVYGRYWKLSTPPKSCDVLLPSSMFGQYRLFFPSYSESGLPMEWNYEPRGSSFKSSQLEGISYAKGPTPAVQRVVGYKEPPFLVDKRVPSPSPQREVVERSPDEESRETPRFAASTAPAPFTPKVTIRTQLPPPVPVRNDLVWKVYHCTDELGSHTIVCIGDTVAEIRPERTVKIIETNPEEWLALPTHQGATNLGQQNASFSHVWLAYSLSVPQTHALIGKHALHVEDAVTIAFTKEAPPSIMQQ